MVKKNQYYTITVKLSENYYEQLQQASNKKKSHNVIVAAAIELLHRVLEEQDKGNHITFTSNNDLLVG